MCAVCDRDADRMIIYDKDDDTESHVRERETHATVIIHVTQIRVHEMSSTKRLCVIDGRL
jgi:hypothetical protein